MFQEGVGSSGQEAFKLSVWFGVLELIGDLGEKLQGHGGEQKPHPSRLKGNRHDEYTMVVRKVVTGERKKEVANLEMTAEVAFF